MIDAPMVLEDLAKRDSTVDMTTEFGIADLKTDQSGNDGGIDTSLNDLGYADGSGSNTWITSPGWTTGSPSLYPGALALDNSGNL